MVEGLIVLVIVIAAFVAVSRTSDWLFSAPRASATGPIADLRRALHAKGETSDAFCQHCRVRPVTSSGFCSEECAVKHAAGI